jgi:hypothetical protein
VDFGDSNELPAVFFSTSLPLIDSRKWKNKTNGERKKEKSIPQPSSIDVVWVSTSNHKITY